MQQRASNCTAIWDAKARAGNVAPKIRDEERRDSKKTHVLQEMSVIGMLGFTSKRDQIGDHVKPRHLIALVTIAIL